MQKAAMLRVAIAAAVLGFATSAGAVPCKLDPKRAELAGTTGYGDRALVCDGEHLDDIWAQFSADGQLVGINWSEYQGDHLKRTIRIDTTGRISFISHDSSIKGGFFKQTRGTSHFMFPRNRRMAVAKHPTALKLVVRDPSGRVWHLVGKPVQGRGFGRVSYTVISIDDHAQPVRPIDFTKRGIVAVDLVAPYAVYLHHHEPQMHGLADRRSRRYRSTKSVFHDGRGNTCAVANEQLFQPRASDPDDKADNELRFGDDEALAEFLAVRCPKLDLRVLGGTALAR